MGAPTPEDQSQGFENPFILHHMSEFDVAADLGLKNTLPTCEFIRCEHIQVLTEFDCSQRIEKSGEVALHLTFHLPADEPSPSLARDVSDLLQSLHESEKALGGQGLELDLAASRDSDSWLSLVLLPNDQHGAANRFQRMAEQLGSPITSVPMEVPKDATFNGILADIAARWEERAAKSSEPNSPHERISRYRIQFALVSRPHAA